MAVVTVLEFPAMTREQYEQVGAALDVAGPPEGILYHACAPVGAGWRISDVWTSREAFDRFVDGVYLPAVRRCGVAEPSRREALPAYHAGPFQR